MSRTALIGRVLLGALYTSIAVAIFGAVILVSIRTETQSAVVSIAGQNIEVTIADTSELQAKGLSDREELKQNEGMFFVFQKPGLYGFWMKDMLFPIDIIWLDAERRIVDVWENASPSSYPQVKVPSGDSKYVLEVNAGFFQKHTLKYGDVLEFELTAGYNR